MLASALCCTGAWPAGFVRHRIGGDGPVPVNSEGEAFIETRAQDVDLPVRFTVRYNDADRDLDVGSQTVKRIIEPSPTVHSQNEATLDLPLTLTAQEAKEVALRQGFRPWLERIMHQWALTWEHIDLDPGDVVTFALADGRSFTVRILRFDIGRNLEIRLETVAQDSSSYDVEALADGGRTFNRVVVAPSDYTQLVLADSPLLADGDDAERKSSGLYWAIGGIGQPGWTAGVVFESRDGAGYVVLDESTTQMTWGVCQSALGDTDLPVPDRPREHSAGVHDGRHARFRQRAGHAGRGEPRAGDRSRRGGRGDRMGERHPRRRRFQDVHAGYAPARAKRHGELHRRPRDRLPVPRGRPGPRPAARAARRAGRGAPLQGRRTRRSPE